MCIECTLYDCRCRCVFASSQPDAIVGHQLLVEKKQLLFAMHVFSPDVLSVLQRVVGAV
jgi:hypothetical protein